MGPDWRGTVGMLQEESVTECERNVGPLGRTSAALDPHLLACYGLRHGRLSLTGLNPQSLWSVDKSTGDRPAQIHVLEVGILLSSLSRLRRESLLTVVSPILILVISDGLRGDTFLCLYEA